MKVQERLFVVRMTQKPIIISDNNQIRILEIKVKFGEKNVTGI